MTIAGTRDRTRERIVGTAARLVAEGGREALTTRAVAAAAGVQAPVIYRLFGDKRGLLDAVVAHGFEAYLSRKAVHGSGDPVDDLRAGWDLHVGFGLANPGLYVLMYGDPEAGPPGPAAARAHELLRSHLRRVARAGRLRVDEELAAALLHSSACGTVLTLLAHDHGTGAAAVRTLGREAAIAAITTDPPAGARPGIVEGFRAAVAGAPQLTPAEHALLREWLDRLAG